MKKCEKCGFCFPDEITECERCHEKLTEYDGQKKAKEFVISDREYSRRRCIVVRKIAYYAAATLLFAAIPISVLYGWNAKNLEKCVGLIMIFAVTAVILLTLSCILESLTYMAFGSASKNNDKEE